MKKIFAFVVCSFILSGCGNNNENIDNSLLVNDQASAQNSNKEVPVVGSIIDLETPSKSEKQKFSDLDDIKVDIDFTYLSKTMAYAQLSNMMYPYENYLGQTVKIQGEYYFQEVPQNNMTYHFLLLMDDTNCCQGVMEFLLPEGASYPAMGTEIRIAGTYVLDVDDTGSYPVLSVTDYAF